MVSKETGGAWFFSKSFLLSPNMSSFSLPDAFACYVTLSKDPKYRENPIFKWKLQNCEPYLLEHDSLKYFVIVMCCCGDLKENGSHREPLRSMALFGGSISLWRQALRTHIYSSHTQYLCSFPVVFISCCISLNTFSSIMSVCILLCPTMTIMD